MKKLFLLSIFNLLLISALFCQEEYAIGKITVINYGDGRYLFRDKDTEKTLEGEHRIIDGYRSEYTLAQFKNGMYDGSYKYYKNNLLKEEGYYKEGRRHGDFKEYFNGSESLEKEYTCVEGKLDGVYMTYHQNGSVSSEIHYKNGKEHGTEKRYNLETGELRAERHYKEGKLHGREEAFITSNRNDYFLICDYTEGQKDGEYSETLANGVVQKKGTYKKGKMDGKWVENTTEGLPKKEATYKNGVLDGESRNFYTDGTLQNIITYQDGKKNGPEKVYHFRGGKLKSEYVYKDNKKHGDFKTYSEEGMLEKEGRCENGKDIAVKSYYKNGQLRSVQEMQENRLTTVQQFAEDGTERK